MILANVQLTTRCIIEYMMITSTAFEHNQTIPKKYTGFGENVNPPLFFGDLPQGTQSLALFVEDPDVPSSAGVSVWDHWVVFNIPPNQLRLPEKVAGVGISGRNTSGDLGYTGPRPPDSEHRYFFKLFALNAMLPLKAGATKQEVVAAMEGHIIDRAILVGRCAPEKSL